jgi:predicted RNA-binding Zn-ribbon protein involved in translation (DUF1610 family)
MKLPYYEKHYLRQVEVTHNCPGCGKMDKLAMRSKVISYMHDKTEYYVGCNCGWMGPIADNPILAGIKWDARAMISQLSEVVK